MLIWMMTNNNNEGKPPLTKTVYEGLTVFFQTVFFKLYFCKMYFYKVYFSKCIIAKCTQLVCLLSFAIEFSHILWSNIST